MSITSMTFLFIFLPISLVLYHITPGKLKEFLLLAISFVFYALGSVEYIALFTFSVILTVLIGRGIDIFSDKKAIKNCLLFTGISVNIALLGFYKYTNFVLSTWNDLTAGEIELRDIALPLGISFFTFKSISYLIDVYKEKAVLSKNPLHDALYLSFFPQIQSGPLSRYCDLSNDHTKHFDFDLISDGVYRFMIGFSKKILLANVLSKITIEIFNAPIETSSTAYVWLGSICYSLQLFFDFSGYSDMAIGLTEMFGYKCPENFNYPYITDSVSKFWRRWHITLSEWFRDYIYIPMGGSRSKNKARVYFNLFVVWLLTGIWHGAAWNFVAWGLGYFVVISFEKCFNLPGRIKSLAGKILYRILSLLFINFQWVLFNSKDLLSGLCFIKRMILPHTNDLTNIRALYLMKDYAFFILIAILLSTPIIPVINRKLEEKKAAHIIFETAMALVVIGAFLWSVSFIVAGQNNPFAYANF